MRAGTPTAIWMHGKNALWLRARAFGPVRLATAMTTAQGRARRPAGTVRWPDADRQLGKLSGFSPSLVAGREGRSSLKTSPEVRRLVCGCSEHV